MGPPVDQATRERVSALFSEEDHDRIVAALEERCGINLPLSERFDEDSFRRVRYAVLKLSKGTMHELERAIDLANLDWRDLLVAAGFADDVRAHSSWHPDPDTSP